MFQSQFPSSKKTANSVFLARMTTVKTVLCTVWHVNNCVIGVTEGYEIKMEIHGVGYRVQQKGKDLEFALGYSHPVPVKADEGITFAVDGNTKFSISGIDKQQVGQVAANIRRLRKHDPYKGKGIRYVGEQVRRKVGKTGK